MSRDIACLGESFDEHCRADVNVADINAFDEWPYCSFWQVNYCTEGAVAELDTCETGSEMRESKKNVVRTSSRVWLSTELKVLCRNGKHFKPCYDPRSNDSLVAVEYN